jgi:hypothetical protein
MVNPDSEGDEFKANSVDLRSATNAAYNYRNGRSSRSRESRGDAMSARFVAHRQCGRREPALPEAQTPLAAPF